MSNKGRRHADSRRLDPRTLWLNVKLNCLLCSERLSLSLRTVVNLQSDPIPIAATVIGHFEGFPDFTTEIDGQVVGSDFK